MKNLKKRVFSGIIALCMVITMIPISAFALDEQTISQMEEIIIDNEDNTQELSENENQSEAIIQSEPKNVIEEDEKTDEITINEEQISEITQNNYNKDAELLENEPTSGQCGDNLYWDFDTSTGTLTISGTGDMHDYYDAPWENYKENITSLVLGFGITSIGESAFQNCSNLTGELVIPNSVTRIGGYAFHDCSNLTGDLIIPSSVTTIGSHVFENCSGFTGDLIIPSSITEIKVSAFENCSGFTGKLIIPSSVVTIGSNAFSGCSGFTGSLIIPDNITTIGSYTFSDCSGFTGSLIIPSSITKIGGGAFSGCSNLTGDLIIPDSITIIEGSTFSGCSGLTGNLTIPDSVTEIRNSAFSNCTGFTGNLIISNNTREIGSNAFSNCSGFTGDLIIPGSVATIGSNAFINCSGFTGNLIISEGVITIEEGAFKGCSNFTGDLIIPDSVTRIGGDEFTYGQEGAFEDCSGFTGDLIIPDAVTRIGDYAFSGCKGLTGNLILPDSVATIGSNAFSDCSGFTGNLIISNNTREIGSNAFSNCSGFTGDLIIPGSVATIGSNAFINCSGFTGNLIISEGVITIEEGAFKGCSNFTGDLIIPDSVTRIGGDDFIYGRDGAFENCSGFTGDLIISESVTKIEGKVFKGCNGFTGDLIIPSSATIIEDHAFEYCRGFTSLVISNGVTEIGYSAFNSCRGLNIVIIPVSIQTIDECAFSSCDSLTDVYYGGSEEQCDSIRGFGGYGNSSLYNAAIHYNSTGPDDPGTASKISYVAGILKSYDSQEKKIYFEYYDGIIGVYEYKITDQTIVEDWDILIGKPVLVSYIPGEYGTDTLSRYVITVQLAEPIIGKVDATTESTITLDGKVFDINSDNLIGFEYYIGKTVVCYVNNNIIVDMKVLERKTGVLNAGSNTSVTIDGIQYAAIFDGIPPYLPAPELWFEHEVEYYFYNDGANQIIYKISLNPYSSTFTAKLTQWEGTTVTFEDGTIRQVSENVAFDSTLIGKWVDYTVETTDDGGNIIISIMLAKPTYKTEVKKLIAWNDGNPQFSDGTTMGVFIIGDQYDPIMIGRWVELTIEEDLNTGTRITGISLVEPSSECDFKLLQSSDIYLKNNQYSFDGQNYEDSSEFEIEFEISIKNIVEGVTDSILSEMKTDANMELTVEDIQITEPNGFNFGWGFPGPGEVGDAKGLEIPAGEIREGTGFIRPGMWYFVDEKEVTETITCKIVLSNGDVFEKQLLFTIHNLDYEEPSTGGDGEDGEEEDIEFTSWEKGLLSEFYKAKDIDVTMQSGKYSLSKYFEDDVVEDICKTVSVWAGILKTDLAEETKGTLPTYLKIQAKMNSDNDKHEATIFFKYDYFYNTSYASLDYISYALVDNETNRKFISDSLFSASTSASFRNFADGVNAYLTEKYGEEAEDFCEKISKQAIEDFANMTAVQYVGTMLKLLTEFEELAGHIDQIKNILENPLKVEISSLKEFNDIAAKCASIECPVDVWVYNKDNILCGKIENNSITYDTHEVFLYVENDEKMVWFSDDIHFELISTDTGSMDYDITEYENGEASRRVEFQNVPLQIGVSYTTDVPVENGLPADVYILTSNNGTKVEVSEDIDLTEDDIKPETTPVTGVTLNMQSIKFNQIDKTEQLIANITPDNATNKSVIWTSSDDSIATVDNNGLVTALANGTTIITAKTVDGGFTANCTVTVDIESESNNTGSSSGGNSSGGGSITTTSYPISISDTDGGTITISPKTASKDKTVTITAVPDEGYKLDTLSVSDKNGNQIELTKKTDTEYTFKMPASKVTVNATFSKIIVDPEPSSMPFTDVSENAWYYNAVRYVYENGMMQGVSDTEFAPTLSMNRAMIVTVLHRLENTPVTTNINQFTDVQSSQWYTEAVQWAAEQGIVSGYGNGQFGTTDNVTREQLAVILYNYTKHIDGDVSVISDMTIFTDANSISNWAEDAISWAVGVGLMSGKGNNILDPTGTATRAEVAQMLINYCTKIA